MGVILGVDDEQPGRKCRGQSRTVRSLIGTRCKHHLAGANLARRGLEHESAARMGIQAVDVDSGLDGGVERSRIAFQVGDDVVARDESLRVVAVVRKTRQAHRPI